MRIAFLGSPTSWYFRDLERAAEGRHEIVPLDIAALRSDVAACVGVSTVGRSLCEFDVALVRSMPRGSLEQIVFRMDALAQLEAAGVRVVNPAKAIEAAVDKYLTTARLASAGLPVPRTIVCQTIGEALRAFDELGRDVVLKPLFGGEGRGIARLTDESIAGRTFRLLEQLGSVLYLQEFIQHDGSDVRILLIGDEFHSVRRVNPRDWRTNVSLGATAERYEPSVAQIDLARRAATAVGAPLAGVDLLQRPNGTWTVLEVNAVPGWQATARATGVDIAQRVLKFLASA